MKKKHIYNVFLAVLMGQTIIPVLAQEQPPPLPEQTGDHIPDLSPDQPHVQYYIEENGQKLGPLSLQQMQERIGNRSLKRYSLVWKTGEADWSKAESFEEFKFTNVDPPDLPLDTKFRSYLIGVWEMTIVNTTSLGIEWTESITTRYESNGTFSSVKTTITGGETPPVTHDPISGKWSVIPISNNKFTITIQRPQQINRSFMIRIIDQNTVFLENAGVKVKRTDL